MRTRERIDAGQLEIKDTVVAINRATKVVKGGKNLSFSALVVVGDGHGVVGYGVGKAKEVPSAIKKGIEAAKKNLIYTIARPTRPPGEYTVVWDGKDDLGKPVPRGAYNLFIETAREHGTNGLFRTRVTLGDEPFAEELKGNVEIRSATVEYRRRNPAR